MASIRKDGKRWRAEVRKAGQYLSKTFPTKMRARSWADDIELQIAKGMRQADYTLSDAIDRFLKEVSPTRKGYKRERKFLEAFQRQEITLQTFQSITAINVKEWRDMRLKQVSGATVNREMNVLSAVFQAGIEWDWTTDNVVRGVKRPQVSSPRFRRPTDDEIERIQLALGFDGEVTTKQHEVAVAFLLAIETAMRLGEICGLRLEHMHIAKRYVSLPETKNGTSRDVPLSKKAVELLELVPFGFTVSMESASVLFRKACQRAEIEGLHFHDSRREALTRISKKVDVMKLAKISGHKDLKTLMNVYYAPTATELAELLD